MNLISPFGPTIGEFCLTKEQNDVLVALCEKNVNDNTKNANATLMGFIEKEFFIDLDILEPIFTEKVLQYLNNIQGPFTKFKPFRYYDIFCQNTWCNIQGPGEFNPIHNHSYYDIVCVTFPKIKVDINFHKYQTNDKISPGGLNFIATTNEAKLSCSTYEVIPKEGMMYVFPGSLLHYTTPFYKEGDERWSTSTNFSFTANFYHNKGLRKQ